MSTPKTATKKSKRVLRDVQFMMRLTPPERALFEQAANEAGLQISSWMRSICSAAARRMLTSIQ
jgi:uncharacterized protein (DUF1778 family)